MNLSLIKNIGPKTEKTLNKLNIFTIEDLLTYYPYKYNIIRFIDINSANSDENCYILAKIISNAKVSYIKRNFNKLSFLASSNDISFNVIIFNRVFLKNKLTIDKNIVLVGKYNKIRNVFTASNILFNIEDNRIEPIYHLTDKIKNSNLENFIAEGLKLDYNICDYVPDIFNNKYKLLPKNTAIKLIHQPRNIIDIKMSKLKLIYEELFIYMFKINYLKQNNKKVLGIMKKIDKNYIEDFLCNLNFKLTVDQEKTIDDILNDMQSKRRMNRLVLGDVGSGKTIVAIIAMLANYTAGYQSAFMAPTEILAKQHFEVIQNYFENYSIKVKILTGSLSKKNKEMIYSELKDGQIDIIIGTSALLNADATFKNLGLVITDEQHRFGVNQRSLLQNKDIIKKCDVLYLSATPIPRTLALTIYGDLDLSQIKTKPSMRKSIITKVISEKNIKEMLLKMVEELNYGHQMFVVSPLIEQNDELDVNSVNLLKEKLNKAFKNRVVIKVLHGRLKQKEKDILMLEFQKGNINILISTTVIEVGIDIPNATMMIIYNAERFGLATLHQLRGRVGRNNLQSYCYLVTEDTNNLRLKVMEESNDGFYISEKDFEQRGQGDLFGVKQSGELAFKIADFKRDYKILMQAKIDSEMYLEKSLYKENLLYKNIIEKINFLD